MMAEWTQLKQQVQRRWQTVSARERMLVQVLAWVLLLAVVWRVGIDAPWQTLQSAPQQRAAANQQMADMLAMQKQAQDLKARPQLEPTQAYEALADVSRVVGKAVQLPGLSAVQGGRVRVQINDLSAEALAQWLVAARERAQALPVEAHWTRNKDNTNWSGTVVLALSQSVTP